MVLLSGCGMDTFTQRETNPFIRDWYNNVNEPTAMYITDASRRIVFEFKRGENPNWFFNRFDTGSKNGLGGIEHAWDGNVVCIDPSPDASIAASGSVNSKLNVSIPASAEFGGEASRSSSSTTIPLLRRSQGLQWGRDNITNTCLMLGMGMITHKQYREEVQEIRDASRKLIELEINKIGPLQLCCAENKAGSTPDKDAKK